MTTLSTVSPDWSDLVAQLQTALSSSNAWKDLVTSSTGQTLIDFQAAIGAYDQFSIESAFQEVFPGTAKNDSSIYAATQYLGIRLSRRNPASVSVSLTNSSLVDVILPINSSFSGAGASWFNRNAITVPAGSSVTTTLYQGKVVTLSITGLGTDYQSYVSQENNFVISDTDVYVKVNSNEIFVTTDGLWTREGLSGCQNLTLSDGRLLLVFGNDTYGSRPQVTDTVTVTYVVTYGVDGNNVVTTTKNVAADDYSTISGTFTSNPSGGGNQPGSLVYKNISPSSFGTFNSAVTKAQYKVLPLSYPGVLDAMTFAQHEINPFALNWMNVIKVCLLTSSTWSDTDWENFKTWWYKQTMYAPRIYREDPVATVVNLSGTVYCSPFSNLGEVQTQVNAAATALFAPRQGILASNIYRSDIIEAVMSANANIEYFQLTSPISDILLSESSMPAPRLNHLGHAGNLPQATYDYAISAVLDTGAETAPANWLSVVANLTQFSNDIGLAWDAVLNATSYKVWGRTTPDQLGLLGTVAATSSPVLYFADDGTVTPTGTVPAQGSLPVFYPTLGTLNLTCAYSTRTSKLVG